MLVIEIGAPPAGAPKAKVKAAPKAAAAAAPKAAAPKAAAKAAAPKAAAKAAAPKAAAAPAPSAGAADVDALTATVTKIQSDLKLMKKAGAAAEKISETAAALEKVRAELAVAQSKVAPKETFPRKAFDDTIVRKMFVIPSFEIHGGVKGLFDLGPPACGLKANIIDLWRKHFVLTENMLEVSSNAATVARSARAIPAAQC